MRCGSRTIRAEPQGSRFSENLTSGKNVAATFWMRDLQFDRRPNVAHCKVKREKVDKSRAASTAKY